MFPFPSLVSPPRWRVVEKGEEGEEGEEDPMD
jgi:hypothetical protein